MVRATNPSLTLTLTLTLARTPTLNPNPNPSPSANPSPNPDPDPNQVDAKHIERHLDRKKPKGAVNEAVAQVAFADRLLLNKVDLVSAKDLTRVEARLRRINHVAPLRRCERSKVSVDDVLDIDGFDLERALEASPGLLNAAAPPTKHDGAVTSVSLDQGAPRHLRTVLPGDVGRCREIQGL